MQKQTVRSAPIGGAPIARTYLDTARTPMRLLFGILFVSYCAISTVIGVRDDLSPLVWSTKPLIGPLSAGLAIGMAIAGAIFIGQVLLAESALLWYVPLLAIDAYYTQRWSGWLDALIRARIDASPFVEDAIALVVTWAAAIAAAYFGERLIFGKRRR